jgi:hypothetical protein
MDAYLVALQADKMLYCTIRQSVHKTGERCEWTLTLAASPDFR